MENQLLIITTKRELLECIRETHSIKERQDLIDKDEILKRKDVAEMLNISLGTLNSWMQRGVIEYTKIGKRVFFSKQAVLDAVKARSKKRKR